MRPYRTRKERTTQLGLYTFADAGPGVGPARLEIGIDSHARVAGTSGRAGDEYSPTYAAMMDRIGRGRGWGY